MYLHVPDTKRKSHYIKETKKKSKPKIIERLLWLTHFRIHFPPSPLLTAFLGLLCQDHEVGDPNMLPPFSSLPVAPAHSISSPLQLAGSCDWFQPWTWIEVMLVTQEAEAWLLEFLFSAMVILGDTCWEASATRWHLNRSWLTAWTWKGILWARNKVMYFICYYSLLWANIWLLNTSHFLPWN